MTTMTLRSRALCILLLGLLIGYAALGADPPPTACSFVDLSVAKPDANNAADLAQKLAPFSDLKVQALSASTILICGPAGEVSEVKTALNALAAPAAAAPAPDRDTTTAVAQHSLRLYYLRDAKDLATALNGIFSGINVGSIGTDQLVFQTSKTTDEANIKILRRWVAILDTPRPELSMHVWNVQLSSEDKSKLGMEVEKIKKQVNQFNEGIQQAFEGGWKALLALRAANPSYATQFASYVDQDYAVLVHIPGSLKYGKAFNPLRQDITSMLGYIISTADAPTAATLFVNGLEGHASASKSDDCEISDENETNTRPTFHCLRAQFAVSTEPAHLAFLRRAMANFLFHYKMSVELPDKFHEYEFSHSAQTLDTELDPLFLAFNRDTAAYLRRLEKAVMPTKKNADKDISFSSTGIVDIRTISGVQTQAGATTESSFATTPPALLQDFAAQLTKAEAAGGTTSLLDANLATHAAAALTAFLNTGQSATVSLSRGTTLTVTPHSLPGAGSAELEIQFEVKDASAPSVTGAPSSAPPETTNRLSDQSFTTTVRVDSLRLFPASSFAAQLSRSRKPIPLLPPFVELPYIGSFIKYKPTPSLVYHQTIAVVSATVVPTAADMLNGLSFASDNAVDLTTLAERNAQRLLDIACEANKDESDCKPVTIAPVASNRPN
jgi:hypothetical protein